MTEPEILGRLVRDPERRERYTLLYLDGTVSNRFHGDDTRAEVAAILDRFGLKLRDDDTVVRAARFRESPRAALMDPGSSSARRSMVPTDTKAYRRNWEVCRTSRLSPTAGQRQVAHSHQTH
jgi:hypothetical protein